MSESIKEPRELQSIYERRFTASNSAYRKRLWQILTDVYFQKFIRPESAVLDLGCGYGEFINAIKCREKYAIDLNARAADHLAADVRLYLQDCSEQWPLEDETLDVVFTSNFFEHLPDKLSLKRTLLEAKRCLRPGGLIIAVGPNIRCVNGAYWDFWDHFLCLTEKSLSEALENNGYRVVYALPRFLPYTTVNQPAWPMWTVKLYLALPMCWRLFGQQFLVIAERNAV
jgi:SAM-dependent methyltransferase